MAEKPAKSAEEIAKELDNAEVTELEDEALEGVAGGQLALASDGDNNCGCSGDNNCGCGE